MCLQISRKRVLMTRDRSLPSAGLFSIFRRFLSLVSVGRRRTSTGILHQNFWSVVTMATPANGPVYLDFNATTPLDAQVKDEMIAALDLWRNPSSSYAADVKLAIENARKQIGDMINAQNYKREIIFTSGGSESNNWVLFSIPQSVIAQASNRLNGSGDICKSINSLPHVITSNIEHDAIKYPVEELVKKGKIEASFVAVNKVTGAVDVSDLLSAIKPNTVLITLMLANNETGVIQPVSEIGLELLAINNTRIQSNLPKIHLHSDAAQAIGKIPVNVQSLLVDSMTIVGHKFYGPRIGALYLNSNNSIDPLFYGGGQESGLRPGTENTPCIVGLGAAAEIVTKNLDTYHKHFIQLKEYFTAKIKERFTDEQVLINFNNCNQLPNTISVSIIGSVFSGKEILRLIGNKLQASTGSACHSNIDTTMKTNGKLLHSSVLISSGLRETIASKTIRLSLGRETRIDELDQVVAMINQILDGQNEKIS